MEGGMEREEEKWQGVIEGRGFVYVCLIVRLFYGVCACVRAFACLFWCMCICICLLWRVCVFESVNSFPFS